MKKSNVGFWELAIVWVALFGRFACEAILEMSLSGAFRRSLGLWAEMQSIGGLLGR